MALSVTRHRRPEVFRATLPTAAALLGGLLVAVLITQGPGTNDAQALLLPVAFVITMFFLLWPRYELTLLLVMLYLGLLDGYLKLSTGIPNITLLRDVLLYAIVAGAAVRLLVAGRRIAVPPMTGLVIAWVVVVLVQVFNPGSTLAHGIQSTRQHLEFVPLFFFGAAILTTNGRLRWVLVAASVVAAINAVFNLIQSGLTPEQFAGWGSGYRDLVLGGGGVSGRNFVDVATGRTAVRPFGLGGDFGFGGIVCAFAVGPVLTLVLLARQNTRTLLVVIPGLGLIIIGLVTAASRTAVLGAAITAVSFAVLSVASRKAVIGILMVAALGATSYTVVRTFTADSDFVGLTRYKSIAPNKVVGTVVDARSAALTSVPTFAAKHPLGVGLGTFGPASSKAGGAQSVSDGNSENEFSFLLAEVGIPGAVILATFLLTLLWCAIRVVRCTTDPTERLLLAGLAAPLGFLAVTWFTGTSTTGSWTAGYLWLVAGAVAARVRRPTAPHTAIANSIGSSPREPST